MFKKIREIARKGPVSVAKRIPLSKSDILFENVDIKKVWKNILFHYLMMSKKTKTISGESGPSTLKKEV